VGVNESPQDFSEDYITWSIGPSLKRLRTDRLDLAMLHNPRSSEQVQRVVTDSVPALCELRSEGVIGAV
jgi:D-threo-aldose 1-dehydrogenase